MANLNKAKGFVNIIKSVSPADIAKEANRPLSLAIVGAPEQRALAATALYESDASDHLIPADKPQALPETPFVQAFDNTTEEVGFPQEKGVFDFVLDVGGGRVNPPEGTLIYSVPELGGWNNTLDRILEDRPELALPLARNFPVFRRRVAQTIITDTATANAQFALITGVTEALPFTSVLLPVNAFGDIVVLTKNQAMMILRLAGAYGLQIDYKSRSKEIVPLLGNAFGWRAIARELVGAVPLVGFIVRAMISYAGTVTVGKAAQYYYETGENLTSSQARRLYQDAYQSSREKIRGLAETLRKSGSNGGGRLPAPATGNGNRLAPAPAPLGLDTPSTPVEEGPHDPLKNLPE